MQELRQSVRSLRDRMQEDLFGLMGLLNLAIRTREAEGLKRQRN
jgi:hypothetical protein